MSHAARAMSAHDLTRYVPVISRQPKPTACTVTGLGKSTIWEWIAEGKIKVVRVGKRTLVDLDSLLAHVASYQTRTP